MVAVPEDLLALFWSKGGGVGPSFVHSEWFCFIGIEGPPLVEGF